ncbi:MULTISPECIES: hypothetical protein [unclassified Exiguobacterium]|uniref:hypothetical protein n=1 Tax=unclassified Exiguobacterium TaxID=2644629 RepID=UPI001BEB2A59|nr:MULTISPECIES: hypothetical protein [unclassified Exiguobacterium]
MEPFELEEEQRQQVDAVYDIDIHRPITIDVVTGQPLDVGDHLKVIDKRTSDRQALVDLTVNGPAYLVLDRLNFALLNFMNSNIQRSEIETYFRSL